MQNINKINKILLHALLIAFSIIMIFPFVWMISASFKPEIDVFEYPIRLLPKTITFDNYKVLFTKSSTLNFMKFFFNSLFITTISTSLQVITSSMAAYSFAKLNYPGKNTIFMVYLTNMMIPFQVTAIPLFVIVQKLGWYDTHLSLIVIGAFSAFGVFMLRQFYLTIPMEMSEAAKVDGCGNFGIYWKIMLPNLKPALATLIIFTFLWRWNDFQMPYIFLSTPSKFTIMLGLRSFVSEYDVQYAKIMAGTVISLLPIIALYLSLQKHFIEGIAATGIKG